MPVAIRRWQLDRERRLVDGSSTCSGIAARFPHRRPACLDRGGVETLGERRGTRCGVVHCTASRPGCRAKDECHLQRPRRAQLRLRSRSISLAIARARSFHARCVSSAGRRSEISAIERAVQRGLQPFAHRRSSSVEPAAAAIRAAAVRGADASICAQSISAATGAASRLRMEPSRAPARAAERAPAQRRQVDGGGAVCRTAEWRLPAFGAAAGGCRWRQRRRRRWRGDGCPERRPGAVAVAAKCRDRARVASVARSVRDRLASSEITLPPGCVSRSSRIGFATHRPTLRCAVG